MNRYKVKRTLKIDKTEVNCDICGKVCKGPKALKSHRTQMHSANVKDTSNRGRPRGVPKGCVPWNKGLTKDTDDRVKQYANSISALMKEQVACGTYVPPTMSDKARMELSERQSLNNSGGRCKWYDVNGTSVQGTYERQFAECLELAGIAWEKVKTNNHIFPYVKNGKSHSYAPDFYLPDFDLYIEIKGFWWGDDENKMKCIMEQHPDKKVVVILGKDKLDKICSNVKELLPLEPVWSW